MSKEEIKYEINKVLEQLPEKALEELLGFLKELEAKQAFSAAKSEYLHQILTEDRELLKRLAQ